MGWGSNSPVKFKGGGRDNGEPKFTGTELEIGRERRKSGGQGSVAAQGMSPWQRPYYIVALLHHYTVAFVQRAHVGFRSSICDAGCRNRPVPEETTMRSPRTARSTQRATKGFPAHIGPTFRYLIRRNPPMSLRVAYRSVVGLVAYGLFEIPSKSAVWVVHP